MRDPARIDRMIDQLRQLWHGYPDQRLGQLVCNVLRGELEPWHVEDDVALRRMERALVHGLGGSLEAIR